MNLGIDRNCFYANQLTLENKDQYAAHIGDCRSCSQKMMRLINQERAMRNYFASFRIQPDMKEQLLSDLAFVENALYPKFFKKVLNNLRSVVETSRVNFFIFSKNLFSLKNLLLIGLTALIYFLTSK